MVHCQAIYVATKTLQNFNEATRRGLSHKSSPQYPPFLLLLLALWANNSVIRSDRHLQRNIHSQRAELTVTLLHRGFGRRGCTSVAPVPPCDQATPDPLRLCDSSHYWQLVSSPATSFLQNMSNKKVSDAQHFRAIFKEGKEEGTENKVFRNLRSGCRSITVLIGDLPVTSFPLQAATGGLTVPEVNFILETLFNRVFPLQVRYTIIYI